MDYVRDFLFVWIVVLVVIFPEVVGNQLYKVHQGYLAASSAHEQVKK